MKRPARVLEQTTPSLRLFGWAGLVGIAAFFTAVVIVHAASPHVDWTRHYVSEFADGPLGLVFDAGAVVHGLGNLLLTFGLYRSVEPHSPRRSAALLFGLAAAGILLVGLFPADSGGVVSAAGLVHRTVVAASFPIEAVALFVFSAAFARSPRWRRRARLSFTWSALAAASLVGLIVAVHEGFEPGLAERFALAVFMAWEAAVSFGLLRAPPRARYAACAP